jgi:3-oxoacyl-[acyl-carrier protein] reductase
MRNVIVTGGSRGLGLGITRQLAAAGFRVLAIARNVSPALEEAIGETQHMEGEIHFCAFDLTDIPAIPSLVKNLKREHGPLFGIVNNAGLGNSGVLGNMPDVQIEQLIRLNVHSPIMLTKYSVRSMMTGKGGRIVNISSIVAATGYSGLSVYSATKASMSGFTGALARELGPLGITVNNVAPGFIDTEMTHSLSPGHRNQIARRSALQRMAEIEDVAHAVNFLFSEQAKNITGTTVTVDAGNTA